MAVCTAALAMVAVALSAVLVTAADRPSDVTLLPHGIAIHVQGGPTVVAAVASAHSFRLGVTFGSQGGTNPLASPSLAINSDPAPHTVVHNGSSSGIKTSFGQLLVDSTTGDWAMTGPNGVHLSGSKITEAPFGPGAISMSVHGTTASQPQPCLGNGMFDPPFLWARDAGAFAFAVSPWEHDPAEPATKFIHCAPVGFAPSSEDTPDSAVSTPAARPDLCSASLRHESSDLGGCKRSKEAANGLNVSSADACCAACNKYGSDCDSWIWADPKHPDSSGMNCWLCASHSAIIQREGRTAGAVPPPPAPDYGRTGWWVAGRAADWYLSPATTGYDFIRAYYDLTGPPAMPPRYAMGLMATYWGYDSMEEVITNMTEFREQKYPIDATIMDYDWFGPQPCGPKGAQGGLTCGDFGYKPDFFGNVSFPFDGKTMETHGPAELFAFFHEKLNLRWAGIRKPRTYSNIDMSKENGWLLPDKDSVGAGGNNWNYSVASLRAWYTENHLHFFKDGVDYWWNDEGETQFYTYLWWNQAQQAQWNQVRPNERMVTINRAFQPGMQRFPAVTWSGDRQDCSHRMALHFLTSGQPFIACDMTSPSATVLVRQYQNAIFLPIFRVHQMHGVPRFPFHWGTDAHHKGFRAALNLRYHLIPWLYSLFHRAHKDLQPVARPASFEFDFENADQTYMFGSSIVPSVVSTAKNADPNENVSTVNLPPGQWFEFNSTTSVPGNRSLTFDNVPLDVYHVFVRPGSLLTLQDGNIQHTGELGGSLLVHVYSGADATFTLVEDDGKSLDYEQGKVRETVFTWAEAAQTLSWKASGSFSGGPNDFTSVTAVLFVANATSTHRSSQVKLTSTGSITF